MFVSHERGHGRAVPTHATERRTTGTELESQTYLEAGERGVDEGGLRHVHPVLLLGEHRRVVVQVAQSDVDFFVARPDAAVELLKSCYIKFESWKEIKFHISQHKLL